MYLLIDVYLFLVDFDSMVTEDCAPTEVPRLECKGSLAFNLVDDSPYLDLKLLC